MSNSPNTQVSVPDAKFVYENSDGDTWYLVEDPATGLPAVKHVAGPQSSGHISYFEVETFLFSGDGPEHQALRRLLNQDHLSTILIAYDIHLTQMTTYRGLTEGIRSLGAWWHHLETVWIVRSDKTPAEIRDELTAYISSDDQLLVVDITRSGAEWAGVNEAGSSWLKANIKPDIPAG